MPGSHEHDHSPRTGLRIVVGYDGSSAARRAVEQAAYDAGPLGEVYLAASGPETAAALREAVDHDEITALQRTHWHPEAMSGPPAVGLVALARARNADRIHVGTRGLGQSSGTLGSVAEQTIELSDRPVLVFPERAVVREAAARPHVAA